MGDIRFERPLQHVKEADDPATAIRSLDDEEAVAALAAAKGDPYLSNVLASEVQNRLRRKSAIVDNAMEGLMAVDAEGRLVHLNPTGEAMLGWTLEEIRGQPIHDLIHYQDAEGRHIPVEACPLRGVWDEAQVLRHQDQTFTRKDGTRFPVIATSAPIFREGEIVGAVVVFTDITEMKAAEDALRRSERFLQATLDALSSNIAILDEEGTIIYTNAAWERFSLENGGDASCCGVGVNYLKASEGGGDASEDGLSAAAGIREVLAGRLDTYYLEYPCHSPTEKRWFILRVTPFDWDGPPRAVVAHENITRRRLAEEALSRTLEARR